MKKVLLIGVQGMLGHDLLKAFAKGYEVIGVDKEEIDITRQGATRAFIKEISPNVVINATGYTDVDGCEKKMHKAIQDIKEEMASDFASASKDLISNERSREQSDSAEVRTGASKQDKSEVQETL